ncbi:hypothetical protein ACJD0Z_12215 [Flavobacteriaceae bacterium M23B6Z8]
MTLFEKFLSGEGFDLEQIQSIDDPQFGRIEKSDMHSYRSKMRSFLNEYEIVFINSIENEIRIIEEIEVLFKQGTQKILLPVCTVFEKNKQGKAIRLYYSSYPYSKKHKIRPRILPADHSLLFPKPVEIYQAGLAEGDLKKVLNVFTDNATVREPSGGEFTSTNKSALKEFYSFLFSFGGGAPLEHCTETTSGNSTALEYNIVKVGTYDFSPQAGIAVYDWSGSKLTAARIYDDFEPPVNAT